MGVILALDQGTTSSRAIVFDHAGSIVGVAQEEFRQHYPQPGWVEHDASEILQSQLEGAREVLAENGLTAADVAAIGITNQRETTVLWDRATGEPIHNAIVWQDRRTAAYCDSLHDEGHTEAVQKKTGLRGAIISAVDLLRGIGVYAGFKVIIVPGATGYFDTDYEAKATYALSALTDVDLVYVHVEAPDEAGHAGLLDKKVSAIEAFDDMVVGKVLDGIKGFGEYRVMAVTDHYTPVTLRTHTTEPVPFAMCGSGIPSPTNGTGGFSEKNAEARGVYVADGHNLIQRLIRSFK